MHNQQENKKSKQKKDSKLLT